MSGGFTKRCFESVAALQRLNPEVLRDMLAVDLAFCEAHGIVLPATATRDNLDYKAIRDALMGDAVPAELNDIMFLGSRLGKSNYWDVIERQAEEDGRDVPKGANLSCVDVCILLATEEWPQHRLFLERANARARVHGQSSFVYYPPRRDRRNLYREPTEEALVTARGFLIDHFITCGLVHDETHGRATEILPYDHDKEIWFLIRYPGKISRQSGCGKDGNWTSYAYNPEMYDVVAYNKVYGDLRMHTHRKKEHAKYRIAFGRVLFGDAAEDVFADKVRVTTLEPLEGERAVDLFNCQDIPGMSSIAPVEILREQWGLPPRQIVETIQGGTSIIANAPYGTRVVPEDTLTVRRMVVAYKLSNGRKGKLTVHQAGNRVTYERDGDSVVLEDWLRRRGFVKSFVEMTDDASKAA